VQCLSHSKLLSSANNRRIRYKEKIIDLADSDDNITAMDSTLSQPVHYATGGFVAMDSTLSQPSSNSFVDLCNENDEDTEMKRAMIASL
jgi:hypothetical protein